jgi:hypothetical protein
MVTPTPPNPAATTSPPASAAARPLVFVLSPPLGTVDDDRYYYSPNTDVTDGDYAALLAFAASYGYSLAIYQCPDMAVFQASNPTANIRPFAEVPAAMIAMGHEVMGSFQCQ